MGHNLKYFLSNKAERNLRIIIGNSKRRKELFKFVSISKLSPKGTENLRRLIKVELNNGIWDILVCLFTTQDASIIVSGIGFIEEKKIQEKKSFNNPNLINTNFNKFQHYFLRNGDIRILTQPRIQEIERRLCWSFRRCRCCSIFFD